MSSYVLIISVGPVQGFIASARRSRDLWAGSWMLSELAKAVAESLHKNENIIMIFPHAEKNKTLPENVGNKIQVVVKNKTDEELIKLANDAKEAARKRFHQMAKEASDKLGDLKDLLRTTIWESQVDDYLEIQYAWAEITNENPYHQACEDAAKLLAARKATRDFNALPNIPERNNLPKSSLDGARETVLPEKESYVLRKKLGLNQSEQLDCAGVMKRLCGQTEQFTPITRVAVDSWIEQIEQDNKFQHEFKQVVSAAYEDLVECGLATRVKGNTRAQDNKSIYATFPYDAQFLYRSRIEAEKISVRKSKDNEHDKEKAINALNELQAALRPIWKKYGEPCPYWVMLLADGDRMGELLDNAKTEEQHQAITQQLSKFAEKVPDIMREYRAQCVYSGGDDVLGFVPLDKAVDCAEALKNEFAACLDEAVDYLKKQQPNIDINNPTLSVGLAICHINNPLGNVRALAKRAEKEAKGDNYPKEQQRNALGITLAVRSGATTDMRVRWDDDALQTFKNWICAYQNGHLSSRIAYDCRDIFMRTDFPNQSDDVDLLNKIRAAEFTRMLKKTRINSGKTLDPTMIDELESHLNQLSKTVQDGTAALDKLATELITARWLAAKTQRDLGREN